MFRFLYQFPLDPDLVDKVLRLDLHAKVIADKNFMENLGTVWTDRNQTEFIFVHWFANASSARKIVSGPSVRTT